MKRIINGGSCPQVDASGNIIAIAGDFVKKYDAAGTLLYTSANIGTKIAQSRLVVSQVTGRTWVIAGSKLYYLDTNLTTLRNIDLPVIGSGFQALDLDVDEIDRGSGYTADKCWVVGWDNTSYYSSKAYCYLTTGALKQTITIANGAYSPYVAYLCRISNYGGELYVLISALTTPPPFPGTPSSFYGFYNYNGSHIYTGSLMHGVSDLFYKKGDDWWWIAGAAGVYRMNGPGSEETRVSDGGVVGYDSNLLRIATSSGNEVIIRGMVAGAVITSSLPTVYQYGLKVSSRPDGNNAQKNIIWNPISNQWITWTGNADLDHCDLIFLSELSTPSISPIEETFSEPTEVTLSITELDADIRYTRNGSTPDSASPVYDSPFIIIVTETVKAIGTGDDYLSSQVASKTYTYTPPIVTTDFMVEMVASPVIMAMDVQPTNPERTSYDFISFSNADFVIGHYWWEIWQLDLSNNPITQVYVDDGDALTTIHYDFLSDADFRIILKAARSDGGGGWDNNTIMEVDITVGGVTPSPSGVIEVDPNRFQLIAVPAKTGYWDVATHAIIDDGVTPATIKNYVLDQLEDKYGAPISSKVEVCAAYIGDINGFYSFYPGITPPSSPNNFPLTWTDTHGGHDEVVGFWINSITGTTMEIEWGVPA